MNHLLYISYSYVVVDGLLLKCRCHCCCCCCCCVPEKFGLIRDVAVDRIISFICQLYSYYHSQPSLPLRAPPPFLLYPYLYTKREGNMTSICIIRKIKSPGNACCNCDKTCLGCEGGRETSSDYFVRPFVFPSVGYLAGAPIVSNFQ